MGARSRLSEWRHVGATRRGPRDVVKMGMGIELPTPSREQALHALYEAAELEHNLMCTYLYAAFSLRDGEAEGLSPDEALAVTEWRRVLIRVAVEEMSHL